MAKRKLQFLKNTSYDGTDYGPGYDKDTADVEDGWAVRFLNSNRAVEVKKKSKKSSDKSEK